MDKEKYNGRVNIVQPTDIDAKMKMHEKIAIKNTATNYYDALLGDWEWNALAQVFFSAENMQIIQNGLKAGVHKLSGGNIVIPNQNVDSLKIIMRSTYYQYAEHVPTNITEQVERLNKRVLDFAVPTVYSEAVSYVKYLNDQSTLVVPLELPKLNDRNFKQLELKRFM